MNMTQPIELNHPMPQAAEGDKVTLTSRAATAGVAAPPSKWSSGLCDCCSDFTSCCAAWWCMPITLVQLWLAVKERSVAAQDKRHLCIVGVGIFFLFIGFNVVYAVVSTSGGVQAGLAEQTFANCIQSNAARGVSAVDPCGNIFVASLSDDLKPPGETFVACVRTAMVQQDSREAGFACGYAFGAAISAATTPPISIQIAVSIEEIFLGIAATLLLCRVRTAVRARDAIPGNSVEDCCCSCCCSFCTTTQLMRHEGMRNGRYSLCSPTGVQEV